MRLVLMRVLRQDEHALGNAGGLKEVAQMSDQHYLANVCVFDEDTGGRRAGPWQCTCLESGYITFDQ